MVSKFYSIGLFGISPYTVTVEADVSGGMFAFDIVGVPDTAVKEAKNRVRAAANNSGYSFPMSHITVNLAPADLKKEGSLFDLPILLAVLRSSKVFKGEFDDCAFIGEVSLDGRVVPVNGVLAMALYAKDSGIKKLFVPYENATEAAVADGIEIYGVRTVCQCVKHLTGEMKMEVTPHRLPSPQDGEYSVDFAEVKGLALPKKALEIAAAGSHNLLMVGPPGSGKSMLAKRFPTILPDMTLEESIETTKIHSVAGTLPKNSSLLTKRPFRSPHHTISVAGLAGGGTVPRPGEISLAHGGVLFLDEFPEFSRTAMEALRAPIEDGEVVISRVAASVKYPCNFTLIAAMNPCPCGFFGHPTKPCHCSEAAVAKYLAKVSGPMLDRLDIHVEVPPIDYNEMVGESKERTSAQIKEEVNRARAIQLERYKNENINCNGDLTPKLIKKYCVTTDAAGELLHRAFDSMGMSARAYDRILKVARTAADLDGEEKIDLKHIALAIQFRTLDKKYFY
ncbi:MAG: YifB family Mg chelatase-like AAA ATPase [Oscillospiraceae bacterium]|nr:YifB family Mg chelatase-like AAA ATPase [Candidatus Equicaccousia limihippi]